MPAIRFHREIGVTFSCSSVPFSFSRTMAIEERTAVIIIRISASTPGIIKSLLSSLGLNQMRIRMSMPGAAAPRATASSAP